MKRRSGFTLIELLVVVAIIAVLIAILLPSLSKAKTRARTAKCLANVRSMSTAVNMYVTDWGKMFPYAADPQHSWTQLLLNGGQASTNGNVSQNTSGGYGGIDKIRACPEAPTMIGTASPTIGTAHSQWGNSLETGLGQFGGSYGLNGWTYNNPGTDNLAGMRDARGTADATYFWRIPAAKKDASIPLFADCNWRHVFPKTNDGFPANATLEDPGPAAPEVVNHPIWRVVLNRHDKAVNVCFLDNHADTVKLKDLYTLNWSQNWVTPAVIPTLPSR
jgi:prepilin-type N-terminal cleavage/methylation domain-containing protein/prepilin-type processing-associated H-X9-DG protein